MAYFFAVMIHHKGSWLFICDNTHRSVLTQIQNADTRDDDTVEQYLIHTCHAKKMDLAFVDTLSIGENTFFLYLAEHLVDFCLV